MGQLEAVIVPPTRDLGGGFAVRRALPSIQRRMVGPFVFFDQFGPTLLGPGQGLDVRPHPHIGLATVTYVFEGEILHRDSLGSVQPIRPGALNWMTAGRGIVHSERTPPELRQVEETLFGVQSWVALPREREEDEPDFVHYGDDVLPVVQDHTKRVRVLIGSLYGASAPVQTASEMFYADATLEAGAELEVPAVWEERAVFVASGEVEIAGDGSRHGRAELLVLAPGRSVVVRAPAGARLVLLGGPPMDGPRHVWWNFVSSRRERIEAAGRDWRDGRFPPVPGDPESIPLPGVVRGPVHYP